MEFQLLFRKRWVVVCQWFFSSIRDSSLAIHRHLSSGLWKYRLKSTGKSDIFLSPTRLRNGTGVSISAFHRSGKICSCPAALAFMMDSNKTTVRLPAAPYWPAQKETLLFAKRHREGSYQHFCPANMYIKERKRNLLLPRSKIISLFPSPVI